jgi:DNA-binding MurR/RpiR family transcriptional regulator
MRETAKLKARGYRRRLTQEPHIRDGTDQLTRGCRFRVREGATRLVFCIRLFSHPPSNHSCQCAPPTEDDVLIIMSVNGGSGCSADLVKSSRYAHQVGTKTIAIIGFDGGLLLRECTCWILVPVESVSRTEAIQLVVEHLHVYLFKEDLAAHAS